MREGLHGEYWVTLRSLPLVKTLGRGQILDRKVCRLEERPGQIWIAIFPIILAFLLLVTDPLAVHAATVGCKVADVGKAAEVAGFEHDGPGNHRADAGYRQ